MTQDIHIIDRDGDDPTDWKLQVRDGNLEAARRVPYDGTLRFTTQERDHVSYRKDSKFNMSADAVVSQYETKTGRQAEADATPEGEL